MPRQGGHEKSTCLFGFAVQVRAIGMTDDLSERPSAYLDGHTNVAETDAHCNVIYITIAYPELPSDRNTC